MACDLSRRLVIGIASSAPFDGRESDEISQAQGEDVYRTYQEHKLDVALAAGVAFPYIRRLLSLNDVLTAAEGDLVELIVLPRNDPDTGLRVMRSIEHYGLGISRAVFMQGKSPYKFMPALNMSLFLSANERDLREATSMGLPAGQVLGTPVRRARTRTTTTFGSPSTLTVASPTTSPSRSCRPAACRDFHDNEVARPGQPHGPGPLRDSLARINVIQEREEERRLQDEDYRIRVHVALVAARNAPSHERAVQSLKSWGVTVNDAFFVGGIDKGAIVQVLRPHIFFNDQNSHLLSTSKAAPSVHVPFGRLNAHNAVLPVEESSSAE